MSINTFKLEEYLAQHEFTAPYLLCCSDAESFGISEILNMGSLEQKTLYHNLTLGYTEVRGLPQLRKQITLSMYPTLEADNILCFAGAEEGIFCALYTLCEPHDHVIAFTPCYQSLLEIPKLKGAIVSVIELQESNQWKIDINEIKKNIRPNTKCIIINFPHNPTGQVITPEELQDLVSLCDKHGIWLFSDEVYRLLGKPQTTWAKPAASIYPKALSLGVMSKAFGMAGLRVGWIACEDKILLKKIEQMKHYTSICNSAPSEILSLIALCNKDEILARNNNIIKSNLEILNDFFIKNHSLFEWVQPQGGCVGFVKYKSSDAVEAFTEKLVKEQGVLLLPASVYDYTKQYFRIGFGRKNMPESLEKLEQFLKQNV